MARERKELENIKSYKLTPEILEKIRNNQVGELNLSYAKPNEEEVKKLAEALQENKSLTFLNLWSNHIGDEGVKALAEALQENKSLTSLNLGGDAYGINDIGVEGAKALAQALQENKSLTSLNLALNNIGAAGAKALAEALKVNKSLTSLELGVNKIGAKGAKAIAQALLKNSSLKTLNLRINNICAKGAKALAHALQENKSLTFLNLENNNIGAAGAKAIAQALQENKSLTSLNLEENDIGATGAKALADALQKNKSLTSLDLRYNKIGDEGTKAIAQALEKNESLTSLNLRYNKIGDEGAKALADALQENKSLTSLDLGYNNISEELKSQIETLIERNCKIRDEFLSQTKETIKTLNNKNNDSGIEHLKSKMAETPLAHQIYALSEIIEETLSLDKDSQKDDLSKHIEMIKFFLSQNVAIEPATLEKVKASKNQTLSVLLQSFDKNSALEQEEAKVGALYKGQLEEKKSSSLPRAEDLQAPRAAVGMLAKGSQVAQRRGTFDNILVNLTRQELDTLRANIANLQDLSALSKNTLQTNSLEVRKLLQNHAGNLAEIGSGHVSNKQARDYYLNIISSLNGAYVASSAVGSGIIDDDRVDNVGKVINTVSQVIPMAGVVATVLVSVLSGVDPEMQKAKLNRFAALNASVADFDAISKAVAQELMNHQRHLNAEGAEKDIETMLNSIFSGKVLPSNNIAGELVEVITGRASEIKHAAPPAVAVSFVARHAPRPAPSPSPNQSDILAQTLAELAETKAALAEAQAKLSHQDRQTPVPRQIMENVVRKVVFAEAQKKLNHENSQGRW
jgi:Ran GTPase-activating protein (RanGAP) involved in mRNA processing and transport